MTPNRPEVRRRRFPHSILLVPLLVGVLALGGACGTSTPHAVRPVLDPSGRPLPAAVAGADAITWRARASKVLGAMDTFFSTMQPMVAGSVNRQAIIQACAGAVPHLTELSVAVAAPYPDAALERHVREALSGFSQYVRACAADDDRGAEDGFRYYDEGSQAASLILGPQPVVAESLAAR